MKKLLKSKPALIAIVVCVLLLGIGGASGSDNQELKDQLAQITEELNTASSQNEELSQQIQDLTSTVDELTEKNEQLQDDLDSANAQIAELSSLKDQQSIIDDLNSQIQELNEQAAAKEAEISDLQTQLSTAKASSEKSSSSSTSSENNSSSTATSSIETVPESAVSTSYTVYITKTGEKYHRDGCRYLKKSQIAIDKNAAVAQGYTPCSVCNP